MANGDTVLLLIHCPEMECANRQPQPAQLSRAWLKEVLVTEQEITVMGEYCSHSWNLTPLEKENLRKQFAAETI